MSKYQPSTIERKWQAKWKESGLYRVDLEKEDKGGKDGKGKYYLLVELPYPSGDLHMGHWFTFAVTDILGRMKRMQGYNVFFPVGFDAFGLPAENAAIKRGINPRQWTYSNIETMKLQFATMGGMHDFEHGVITCDADYYRWNQWIFLKMLEKGLAYRGKILSNWCPSCQTVLANENVEAGKCWRCGTEVVQKEVEQWMLRITEYAERLLWLEEGKGEEASMVKGLGHKVESEKPNTLTSNPNRHPNLLPNPTLDWPQSIRDGQNNWIGKSEGIEIEFPLVDSSLRDHEVAKQSNSRHSRSSRESDPRFREDDKLEIAALRTDGARDDKLGMVRVFTKFPETIFGVTFMVVAPEHELVASLLKSKIKNQKSKVEEISEYIEQAKKKSEMERTAQDKEKSGVFTGLYCINPVNNASIPIWVADYVIGGYGTGAVMGVPGSDVRDFEFADKYSLPVIQVIAANKGELGEVKRSQDTLAEGYIVNSGQFDGLKTPEPAKEKFMDYLEKEGFGQRKVNYHLHDWSISRQRYWGTPIPIIFCANCAKNVGKGKEAGLEKGLGHKAQSEKPNTLTSKLNGHPNLNPITTIDGKEHAIIPVPEEDLPVVLPEITDYAPKGKPPLAGATDWVNVKCPNCGKPAKREVDTMDTFVDSSWYFLGYLNDKQSLRSFPLEADAGLKNPKSEIRNPKQNSLVIASETKQSKNTEIATPRKDGARNDEGPKARPWNPQYVAEWMPTQIYVGGAEHTLGHTLYSRFFVKFLHDIGELPFEDYALKRINHGVILGPDGARMSKSKGNVVNPDEQVAQFGADAVRMYLAFMGPYDLVAPWNPNGLRGVYHFLQRVWEVGEQLVGKGKEASMVKGLGHRAESEKPNTLTSNPNRHPNLNPLTTQDLYWMHKTIRKVGDDIAETKYNTAVAALMEWLNYLGRKAHDAIGHSPLAVSNNTKSEKPIANSVSLVEYKTMLLLLAPFAPHMTEELWQRLVGEGKGKEASMVKGLGHKAESEKPNTLTSNPNRHPNLNPILFDSIHTQPWPVSDPKHIVQENITIVVQVNGKVRDQLLVEAGLGQEEIEKLALASAKVQNFLGKNTPQKLIFIPGKLLNIVI